MTTTKANAAVSSSWLVCCIILSALIAAPSLVRGNTAAQRSSFWSPKSTAAGFGLVHEKNNNNASLLNSLRGGSSAATEEMAAENDEDEEEEDDDEEDEDEDTTTKVPAIASMEPVRLIISTNWGNPVVDQTVELTPARTRNVASLKKSLSKQLPGRPPIVALEIVYEGRILDDETLVDELFEDDEDEDEDEDEDDEIEEGNEPSRRLTLNIVPPVDPKFATELGPKLVYHGDDDENYASRPESSEDSLTADQLVDAYYMNQVAMSRNAQLLADPNTPSSPFLRMELQEQARLLREQLQSETSPEVWEKCMEASNQNKSGPREEWRGQRYRSSKGGVTTQLKTTIQTHLNVNWEEAIKQSLLFLFLGYFGGKNSFSRHLLLWGAPLSFALQARPVKMWFKIAFYMMSNPPLILLSFLPAPQQAILSVDLRASCVALYGEDGADRILGGAAVSKRVGSDGSPSTTIPEDEEESDVDDEEDDDEYDSEEEDEDDSDWEEE